MIDLTTPGIVGAPAGEAITGLGRSIALSEDGSTLLVAAQKKSSPVFGVVYLFRRRQDRWNLTARLQPNQLDLFEDHEWVAGQESSWRDAFGRAIIGYDFGAALAVSEDGRTIVVGAPGAAADHSATFVGAGYVFRERDRPDAAGTEWFLSSPVTNDDYDDGQAFAAAVAVSGTEIAFGAPEKLGGGGAYLARLADIEDPAKADFAEKVCEPPANARRFGAALALKKGMLFVGDPGSDADTAGSVHGFDLTSTELAATVELTDPGRAHFGQAMAVAGKTLAVAGEAAESLTVFTRVKPGQWEKDGLATAELSLGLGRRKARSLALSKKTIVLGSDDGARIAARTGKPVEWDSWTLLRAPAPVLAVAAGGDAVAIETTTDGKRTGDAAVAVHAVAAAGKVEKKGPGKQPGGPAGGKPATGSGTGKANVCIRDTLSDKGIIPADPSAVDPNSLCASPDIIPLPFPELDYTAAFGGRRWNQSFGQNVRYGVDNYIYLRAQNIGTGPAAPVAHLFSADPAAFMHPAHWTKVGSLQMSEIAAGAKTVQGPIVWKREDIHNRGHYCFVCYLTWPGQDFTRPEDMRFTSADDYYAYVAGHNNVCFRNVNIVAGGHDFAPQSFKMVGMKEHPGNLYSLVVESDLPPDTKFILSIDGNEEYGYNWDGSASCTVARDIEIEADQTRTVEFIAITEKPGDHDITFYQYAGKTRMGGVTYQIRTDPEGMQTEARQRMGGRKKG